jgi:ABC-type multidrug transport system permease subunit
VVKPALIFLDEPTSGLDSFSAVQLCQVLKKVANAGASVLFTIHQPSSEIFNSFDHLILLNAGRVMYQGSVGNVPTFFGNCGHPNPPNYNPADWIMTVAQSQDNKQLESDGFFPKDERPFEAPFTEAEGKDELGITITGHYADPTFDDTPVSYFTEVKMLFTREFKNLTRDTTAIGSRMGISIFMGILIGVIFLKVAETDRAVISNVNSTFGSLIMVLMMGMFGTAQSSLLAFPEERPVFLREYSTDHYAVFTYFLSRLTMEAFVTFIQILLTVFITYLMVGFQSSFGILLAICYALAMTSTALAVLLGCAVEDPKLGQEMLPILFVPQMLFAGFFVTPDLIPVWLRWAQYLCSLTYSVRLSLVEEFGDCGPDVEAIRNCEKTLTNVDANENDKWWYWLVLVCLFVAFRVGALVILKMKATKFY